MAQMNSLGSPGHPFTECLIFINGTILHPRAQAGDLAPLHYAQLLSCQSHALKLSGPVSPPPSLLLSISCLDHPESLLSLPLLSLFPCKFMP